MVSSVYEMDWEKLALTYRGVIFDIDNTLVPHGAPADDRAKELFSRLHGLGMKTALVSNNGEERVRPFAEKVESIYLYKAGKPKKDGYEKAMQQMGTDTENTLFVGDQIFTDVLGANLKRLKCIFVFPIAHEQTRFFRFKRRMEVPFLPREIYQEEKGTQS